MYLLYIWKDKNTGQVTDSPSFCLAYLVWFIKFGMSVEPRLHVS